MLYYGIWIHDYVLRPIIWLSSYNSENIKFKITIADFIQDQNETSVLLLQNAQQ
jgi:hypothetical protein